MPRLPEAKRSPDGGAYSLSDLQQIALRFNPLIRQAHQDIETMRGQALQAGLYPNPIIGSEASTAGQGDTSGNRSPGQQGGFIEQTIVTAGKLTISREAPTTFAMSWRETLLRMVCTPFTSSAMSSSVRATRP